MNFTTKTAHVIGNENASGDVSIPRSIKYQTHDFIVKSLKKESFMHLKTIKSVIFPSVSEVVSIEKDAFTDSSLEYLFISSSISELQDGWCRETLNLNEIQIAPNNIIFIYLNNMMILGKVYIKEDDYNKLIFVNRNTENVLIPSFITCIAQYSFSNCLIEKISIPPNITNIGEGAFYNCINLKEVEFHPDSKLSYLEKLTFLKTSIKQICLPTTITLLNENWCDKSTIITRMNNDKKFYFDLDNIIKSAVQI